VVRVDRGQRAPVGVRLTADRLWLLLPAGDPRARKRPIRLADLDRSRLVLYGPASRTRARVMERLGPRGAEITFEVEGKATAIEFVRRGLGIGFVSALPWVRPSGPGVDLVEVTRLFRATAFYLLVAPSRRDQPQVRELAERIEAEVARRSAHR
jgi:DNA-binding transcriptional LysR family regulator